MKNERNIKRNGKIKRESRDFFEQMEHYQMDYFNCVDTALRFIIVIAVITMLVSMICYLNDGIKNKDDFIPVAGISIIVFIVAAIGFLFIQFLKNSILFRQGIIRNGIINFIGAALLIYIILFVGYFYSSNDLKEFFKSLFVPVTTLCAAILAIIGVHYNVSRQRQETECKNNLIFNLEHEENCKPIILQSNTENLNIKIYLKNVSNNNGFFVGFYRLNGGEIYEIAKVSYLPILPQTSYAIHNIYFNESDDQLILVYTDVNKIYYYLTFDIKDKDTVILSNNNKCDWNFFQRSISYSQDNLEKIKNNRSEKINSLDYESEVIRRKHNTKPLTTVKHGDFEFIINEAGEIITDSLLLDNLRKERLKIARELRKPAYIVFNNQQLVALATYKPSNMEEFISIYGLGEGKYKKYGNRMISIILNCNSKKPQ